MNDTMMHTNEQSDNPISLHVEFIGGVPTVLEVSESNSTLYIRADLVASLLLAMTAFVVIPLGFELITRGNK